MTFFDAYGVFSITLLIEGIEELNPSLIRRTSFAEAIFRMQDD